MLCTEFTCNKPQQNTQRRQRICITDIERIARQEKSQLYNSQNKI